MALGIRMLYSGRGGDSGKNLRAELKLPRGCYFGILARDGEILNLLPVLLKPPPS